MGLEILMEMLILSLAVIVIGYLGESVDQQWIMNLKLNGEIIIVKKLLVSSRENYMKMENLGVFMMEKLVMEMMLLVQGIGNMFVIKAL